jgi:hypothetical protein
MQLHYGKIAWIIEAFTEAAWIVAPVRTPVLCGLGVRLP